MTSRKQLICLVVGSLLLSTGHGAIAQQDEAKPKTPPARIPTSPLPLRAAPEADPKAKAEEPDELENELPQFETGVEFKAMSPRTRVTFNLEEAELPDLVRLISNMTGRRFILPTKLRAIKATVFAPTIVRRSGPTWDRFSCACRGATAGPGSKPPSIRGSSRFATRSSSGCASWDGPRARVSRGSHPCSCFAFTFPPKQRESRAPIGNGSRQR